jgi:lipopolysaccharide transport system permease protein
MTQKKTIPSEPDLMGKPGMSSAPAQLQTWSTVITSRKPLFEIPFRELWAYRDLVILQVQRDFQSVYKQTVLGPLWYFIQPLMSAVVFQVIFGKIVGVPTDKIPPFLFFMSGTIIWYYFSSCLSGTSSTLTSNSGLFTKVYFPRLAIPVSKVISNFWQFLIQLLIFSGFYLFFLWKGAPIHFSYRIIIIPVLVLQTALLGLGCGCLVSAMTTRFRDLQMAVAPFLQLWMYGSCILFPLSMVPLEYQKILILNPSQNSPIG